MRLERFYRAKQEEVTALREKAERGELPAPYAGQRPDFAGALLRRVPGAPLAVVAEYKRSSPSAGTICDALPVEEAARQYARNGASCLSILTEETWFGGNLEMLRRASDPALYPEAPLPLLRKDFLFDELQVLATAATPASALLLIVRLTPQKRTLRLLREKAASFGLASVVEVFDEEDLRIARASGARIIQVNARDLQTLQVDCASCLDLARAHPPREDEIWIAASGIERPSQLREASEAGFRAALVGTALMRGGRPGEALAALLQSDDAQDDWKERKTSC